MVVSRKFQTGVNIMPSSHIDLIGLIGLTGLIGLIGLIGGLTSGLIGLITHLGGLIGRSHSIHPK